MENIQNVKKVWQAIDDIKKVIETQKILIAQKDKYFKHRDDNMDDITISYRLKNGETISRN